MKGDKPKENYEFSWRRPKTELKHIEYWTLIPHVDTNANLKNK